jgi:hypothetical protein
VVKRILASRQSADSGRNGKGTNLLVPLISLTGVIPTGLQPARNLLFPHLLEAHEIIEFLSLCSCGLFSGAALYINLVEHPARMSCGVAVALTEFRPSYKRATVMQASLAAVSLASGLQHGWQEQA